MNRKLFLLFIVIAFSVFVVAAPRIYQQSGTIIEINKAEHLNEIQQYQQKCEKLIQEPEIRFAGFLDMMGNLITGGFSKGVMPLKDETERKKMFIEAVLRVRTRQEFDHKLGPVEYAAARRKNVVVMTFLVDDKVLFVSAEYDIETDKTARKIMEICGI